MKKEILEDLTGPALIKAGWEPIGFHKTRREVLVRYRGSEVKALATLGKLTPLGSIRQDAIEPIDDQPNGD